MVSRGEGRSGADRKGIRDKAKLDGKKEAQKIVLAAIQRSAADHCVETSVERAASGQRRDKGASSARKGHNIRAFEATTAFDMIVDDTPEAVDSFRVRSAAARSGAHRARAACRRRAIHPARIEEIVAKVEPSWTRKFGGDGRERLDECGLHGGHIEILKHIGLMKYRASYGKICWRTASRSRHLTGLLASELGIDVQLAKRAGLLHDIGKTVDRSIEGPHALLGYDLAQKYGEHPVVANAIGSHHEDIPMEHAVAALVQAADAISGARPGARRESVEGYGKRLERLENIAKGFDGVLTVYAIQAGREIRVIVEHEKWTTRWRTCSAHEIAQKIMAEMDYPGQIKVTVIREKRSVAYAK